MTQFPVITPTEEREYLRKARERRFEQRIRTLNALWRASQENNLSARQTELDLLDAKVNSGERLTNDERCRRQGLIFNHHGKAEGFCVI